MGKGLGILNTTDPLDLPTMHKKTEERENTQCRFPEINAEGMKPDSLHCVVDRDFPRNSKCSDDIQSAGRFLLIRGDVCSSEIVQVVERPQKPVMAGDSQGHNMLRWSGRANYL